MGVMTFVTKGADTMGVIKRIIKYDVTSFPHAVIDFFFSFTFQIILLATLYYGGVVLLAYYIFKLPAGFISIIWVMSFVVNGGFIIAFPGLFYFDKVPDDVASMVVIVGLGPFTLPRALVCYLSFRINVDTGSLRKYDISRGALMPVNKLTTHRSILRKPVSKWDIDDPWMNAIKRNTDIGIPSFWDKCRRKWRLVVRIARWKVF